MMLMKKPLLTCLRGLLWEAGAGLAAGPGTALPKQASPPHSACATQGGEAVTQLSCTKGPAW